MDSTVCIENHSIEQFRRRVFQIDKAASQIIGVVGTEYQAGDAVSDQTRGSASVGHHDREIGGHCLQHHQAERLNRAQVQEQIGPGHFGSHIVAETDEFHIRVRAAGTPA